MSSILRLFNFFNAAREVHAKHQGSMPQHLPLKLQPWMVYETLNC